MLSYRSRRTRIDPRRNRKRSDRSLGSSRSSQRRRSRRRPESPDPRTPLATSVRALASLVEDGRVRHIGVSNLSRRQL
jgi:diketogulonate reductase-like aldo/keto reductase